MDRFCQSPFDGPAVFANAHSQCPAFQVVLCGPFRQQFGFSVERQVAITASIVRLRFVGRPSTVPRLVVPVVIDAFDADAVSLRFRPHVGEERLEGHSPAVADRDSATTVSVVGWVAGVAASLNHGLPGLVLRRVGPAVSLRGSAGSFTLKATATLSVTFHEIRGLHNSLGSASASTEPSGSAAGARRDSNSGQAAEHFAGQVFEAAASAGSIAFSHEDAPNIGLVRTARQLQLLVAVRHFTSAA